MMSYSTTVLAIVVVLFVAFVTVDAAGVCTGYPLMYNGKPCASTTRYWDGQMGACGCGTGNTNPFSWQWNKPTAAASAPIFGSGSWCGSGCGKCFKLTPTVAGASPVGKGAPNTNSMVVKVTNLCPYSGNEQWCAYDTNSFGYDAHFDIMDYNMAGIVSNMGWDNPEVVYEEVDCASNGYVDWGCQCASASAPAVTPAPPTTTTTPAPTPSKGATTAPTKAATTAPTTTTTTKPSVTTTTTTKASVTSAPSASSIKLQVSSGVNEWWFGFSVVGNSAFAKIEMKDSSNNAQWTQMAYQGGVNWNMYSFGVSNGVKIAAPLSIRFTSSSGKIVTANNIITSFSAGLIDTKVSL